MSLKILRPGLLTSIQDLGRYGFQKYGIIASGGMDSFALRLANLLVGNEESEAALEMTLLGPHLLVEADVLLALTGADLSARIGEALLPRWRPIWVEKGSIITFGGCRSGCRAYLAVAGGIAVPHVLNSKSTYMRAGIGGYQGRALVAGDVLQTNGMTEKSKAITEQLRAKANGASHVTAQWEIDKELLRFYDQRMAVRVIRGRHFSRFTAESQHDFFNQSFTITPQSDRMGYRLKGPVLALKQPEDVLSEAISHGTIQVPPEGNPIILMSDRQTTGGYPRIAHVATVDIPVVAQCKPGERLCFQEITIAEAERLHMDREKVIRGIKTGVGLKMWR